MGSREEGNVAAGGCEDADIVAQFVRDDRRCRGAVLDQTDEAARLRERPARREPACRGGVSRATHAAETKAPAREKIFLGEFHDILPVRANEGLSKRMAAPFSDRFISL